MITMLAAIAAPGNRAEAALAEILGLNISDTRQGLLQSSEAPSLLASMSHTINTAALFVATVLILWSSLSAVANTAHEGILLGRRYHSMWVPLRSALAVSMLLPLANGYSMVQLTVTLLAHLGFRSADLAWQAALNHIQNSGPVINISPTHGKELSEALFKSNLCMLRLNALYLNGEETLKIMPHEKEIAHPDNKHQQYRLSFDGTPDSGLGTGKCGEFAIRYETTAVGRIMYQGSKTALRRLNWQLNTAAHQFLKEGKTGQEVAHTLRGASEEYAVQLRESASHALSRAQDAVGESNRRFFSEAKRGGWMMAGSWFWTLSAVNRRIADTVQNAPSVKLPDPDNMPSDWQLAISQDLLRSDETVLSKLHDAASAGARSEGFGGLHDKIAGWTHQPMILALDYVNTLFNKSGEPVIALQSFGHGIVSVSTGMISKAIIGEAIGVGTMEGVRGNLLVRLADTATFGGKLDFLKGVGHTLIEWATIIVVALAVPIGLAGLTLAFWLPAVPFIYWLAGVIGWLVLLIEALFIAPLWAAAHAGAEGEGISSYYVRPGYMLILALIARPMMMVLGLFSAMLIVHYGSQFLLYAFSPFVRGMHAQTITGIISIIIMLLLLAALVTAMVNRAYALIHSLPETILNYISDLPNSSNRDLASDTKNQFTGTLGRSAAAAINSAHVAATTGNAQPRPDDQTVQRDSEALRPGLIIARKMPEQRFRK